MRKNWKRNLITITMVMLVCTAVFLNWKYADNAQESGGKLLGQSTLVSGSGADPSTVGEGVLPDESTVNTGTEYFASARLTRQQSRDNAISLLQEAADEKDADQAVLDKASEGIQVLASYTLKEGQIENLVMAKGYADCVAFMGDDSISVVVSTSSGDLTTEDVAKITDIAMTETGYAPDNIKIMASK